MIQSIFLYNFILLASTFLIYISEYDKSIIVRRICLLLAFLIVVIPNAIRYEIGSDYIAYVAIFESIQASGIHDRLELGFLYIIKFLQSLNLGYEWLFILVAILIHTFSFLAYPKRRMYIYHFIFMLVFYFESFNTIRQVLAVTISMYAFKIYSLKSSYLKFFTLVVLASLFHKVALVFLIVPFFVNQISRKVLSNFGWATIFFWLTIAMLSAILLSLINFLVSNVSLLDFSIYLESDKYGTGTSSSLQKYIVIFILLILYSYPFLFFKKVLSSNPSSLTTYLLFFMYVSFWLLSMDLVALYRLQQAFAFSFPLIVVTLLNTKDIPYQRLYLAVLTILLLYSFNTKIMISHTSSDITCYSGRLAPYVTIFNKEDSQRDSFAKELLCR